MLKIKVKQPLLRQPITHIILPYTKDLQKERRPVKVGPTIHGQQDKSVRPEVERFPAVMSLNSAIKLLWL